MTSVPGAVAQPTTRFERAYVKAGDRVGRRLEAELVGAEKLQPRWTPAKVLAVLIAVGVHVLTLAILVGGAVLVASFSVPGIALGLLALAIAWVMRPRLGRPPKDDVVAREAAPESHRVVDEVASALGTGPPDLIVVDEEFNASWSVVVCAARAC